MTATRWKGVRLLTIILLGLSLTRLAHCETLVASDFNTRLVFAFKAPEEALKKRLPPGWELNPVSTGPHKGANVTVGFVDRLLNLDPEGKPIAGGRDRYVGIVVPSKQSAGDQALNFVVRLYTGNEQILPGAYNTSVLADVSRVTSEEGSNVDPGVITDAWQVRDVARAGSIEVRLKYRRSSVSRSKLEQRFSSPIRPDFYRIYRTEQGVDIIRSTSLGVDRIESLALRIDLPEFRDLFNGTEELIGVSAMPWGLRQIYLP